MIHPLSDVMSKTIGQNTLIWQYTVVLNRAIIGSNCNINCHVFIENEVIIGNNVTIKSGVYLWDGINIQDNVFIGPNVTFTNDLRPRSKKYPEKFQQIIIKKFASIGASSTILGGVTVGEYSMTAAGSLVTKDVPSRALVLGSPAKIVAWLNDDGSKMNLIDNIYYDNEGKKWKVINNQLINI
jgi:UDP-2-acetamido-3-amino-2,3-dideoxy-glucuronate N-acetyltransferase